MSRTYEVKFKLFNSKGEQVNGEFTQKLSATKFVNSEARAAVQLAWMARHLGLTFELVSSKAVNAKVLRFKPLRQVVETAKERKNRMARERSASKKSAVTA